MLSKELRGQDLIPGQGPQGRPHVRRPSPPPPLPSSPSFSNYTSNSILFSFKKSKARQPKETMKAGETRHRGRGTHSPFLLPKSAGDWSAARGRGHRSEEVPGNPTWAPVEGIWCWGAWQSKGIAKRHFRKHETLQSRLLYALILPRGLQPSSDLGASTERSTTKGTRRPCSHRQQPDCSKLQGTLGSSPGHLHS